MNPEIHKLMVLSTWHLTDRDRMLLGELTGDDRLTAGPGVFSDQYPYGFHLTLTDPDPAIEEEDHWLGPSIRACVEYARKHGCTHLRLDADGTIVKGLPTY